MFTKYKDWMCFSINHLNKAIFLKLRKASSGEFQRVVYKLPSAEIANAILFLKRACKSSWNSVEAEPDYVPWMSGSVFGLATWISSVHLIMGLFSLWVGGFSWNHLVECAAGCALGSSSLFTQGSCEVHFKQLQLPWPILLVTVLRALVCWENTTLEYLPIPIGILKCH